MMFSNDDQDILKVLKLNQNNCRNTIHIARNLNSEMAYFISETESFVNTAYKKYGVNPYPPSQLIVPDTFFPPNDIEWMELVSDARNTYPNRVSINEILTNEEYNAAMTHFETINADFSRRTGLRKEDWFFLITATALQCVRQYVLDPWIKKNRHRATSHDENSHKGNAESGWYHVDTDKILSNRVPFDAHEYSNYSTVSGFLKGGGHRTLTLGHDPFLGWIFGTANILTNTLTRYDFQSAHVKYILGQGNTIYALADTSRIFQACKARMFNEGIDGKIAVGLAIIREAIHLKSDINTKKSLPLPGVSPFISTYFAEKLCRYGIDTAGVGTEIGLSFVINMVISMVHRLFYDDKIDDPKLFEVRTRKIILYSNSLASISNVIATAITNNYKILDVGGLIVTTTRLFNDIRFITRIKQEFINSNLDISFKGVTSEIDAMNKRILSKS